MAVEVISDTNFGEFCQNEKTVLVFGKSTCPLCLCYVPVIEHVAEILREVRFGQVWLDEIPRRGLVYGVALRLYPDKLAMPLPTTLVSQAGQDWAYFAGLWDYEDVLGVIEQILNRGKVRPADGIAILHSMQPDSSPQTDLG